MKIYVVHDKRGNIVSIAAPSAQSKKNAGLLLQKDQHVLEVDGPEINDESHLHELSEIVERSVVNLKSKPPQLVPKETYGKLKRHSKRNTKGSSVKRA